ncbi:F420-dependent glucose-6-phosphate dehydrogenase [Baekduia alba]|uniref:LLM class flavin-dependent oxidoreductase n=1 Tax=Baekduia alba TaxID=2997333 RepID=UPI0023413174|nr:LLM class flavin-dependent oxidoreductase [Baekduia alba]WCB93205.1 F420-dependent glucose-6-phosphate dehydrogenase [Baekduia alba]
MSSRRAIFVAPFDELADPRLLADLAAEAEAAGWDGFFLWDHIVYSAPTSAVLDPWVAMAAIAMTTNKLLTGPLVTPLSRRRPHKLARETVTLDLLSEGRLVLGVGLGSDNHGELAPFGEVAEPREQATLLDDALTKIQDYWGGTFLPRPVQRPRIPIWAAARWPARRPVRRAARLDGLFPIGVPDPDGLATLREEILQQRAEERIDGPYDLAITHDEPYDPAPWEAAGATWTLRSFGSQPKLADVRAVIAAGIDG